METLVLSTSYEPVGSVDWRLAMSLWVAGRVEVLEHYADRFIRTVTHSFPMPAVIRYLRGRTKRTPNLRFNRDNLFVRDAGECQYCGKAVARAEATYDHVVPRRAGGVASWENMVLACRPCNQRKGGRTPDQAGMPLCRRPVRPRTLGEPLVIVGGGQPVPDSWVPWLPERTRRS